MAFTAGRDGSALLSDLSAIFILRNLFEILLNQTKIGSYLLFSNSFGTKRTSVWFQINRKMVNTFWFRFDLIRFRKKILCVQLLEVLSFRWLFVYRSILCLFILVWINIHYFIFIHYLYSSYSIDLFPQFHIFFYRSILCLFIHI